jgi:rod shape-determining protein MreC
MVERRNRRQRILIITLVIICVLLVTVYSRESNNGLFHRLQRFSMDIISPLQKGMAKVFDPIRDGFGYMADMVTARSERDRLREENEQLEKDIYEMNELERVNEELKNMVAVKERNPHLDLLVVDVIGASTELWEQTIQIGAGYSDGLQEYMAILTEEGKLVGRIIECTSEVSIVPWGPSCRATRRWASPRERVEEECGLSCLTRTPR